MHGILVLHYPLIGLLTTMATGRYQILLHLLGPVNRSHIRHIQCRQRFIPYPIVIHIDIRLHVPIKVTCAMHHRPDSRQSIWPSLLQLALCLGMSLALFCLDVLQSPERNTSLGVIEWLRDLSNKLFREVDAHIGREVRVRLGDVLINP